MSVTLNYLPIFLWACHRSCINRWSDLTGVLQHDFLDLCLGRAFRRGLWSKQVPGELTVQLEDNEQLWFRAHYSLPSDFDLQDGAPSIIKTVVGGQIGVREGWSKQLLKILATLPELSLAEIEQHFGFRARAFLQQLIQMGAVLLSTSSRMRAIDDAVFLGPGGPENAWLEPVSMSQFEQSLYRGCLKGQVLETILEDIQLGRVELHINQQRCLDAKRFVHFFRSSFSLVCRDWCFLG